MQAKRSAGDGESAPAEWDIGDGEGRPVERSIGEDESPSAGPSIGRGDGAAEFCVRRGERAPIVPSSGDGDNTGDTQGLQCRPRSSAHQ